MNMLEKARSLFENNDLTESMEIVTQLITNKNEPLAEAFILRARIHSKKQNWGDAINDFSSVLELDPENQEAISGVEMAKSILGYFTPDMFNP